MVTNANPRARSASILLLALAAGLPLGSCSKSSAGEDEVNPGQQVQRRERRRVRTAPLEQREMVRVFETTTNVVSDLEVQVLPRMGGIVLEVLVEESDTVIEGQVLARLDPRELDNAVADSAFAHAEAEDALPRLELARLEAEARRNSANNALDNAKRDYERNQRISNEGGDGIRYVSQKDLDASRLARDNAEGDARAAQLAFERAELEAKAGEKAIERAALALERARLDRSYVEIKAPFPGVIAARTVKVGDTVTAASQLFTLTDPDALRAVFARPQEELSIFRRPRGGALAQGHGANGNGGTPGPGPRDHPQDDGGPNHATVDIDVVAEALPDQLFRGVVERISPTIDPLNGNFRVTTRIEGESERPSEDGLLPGMLVRLRIVTARHPEALVVEKRAVRREGDRSIIFIVEDGVARRRDVVTDEAFSDDDHVEIRAIDEKPLTAGMRVVVVGNRDLEDGDEVEDDNVAMESGEGGSESDEASESDGMESDVSASDGAAPDPGATSDGDAESAGDNDDADGQED